MIVKQQMPLWRKHVRGNEVATRQPERIIQIGHQYCGFEVFSFRMTITRWYQQPPILWLQSCQFSDSDNKVIPTALSSFTQSLEGPTGPNFKGTLRLPSLGAGLIPFGSQPVSSGLMLQPVCPFFFGIFDGDPFFLWIFWRTEEERKNSVFLKLHFLLKYLL